MIDDDETGGICGLFLLFIYIKLGIEYHFELHIMNLYGIIILLFIVIAVVLFYRWYIRDQKEIVSEWDAGMNPKLIKSEKLNLSTSSRYTFSIWFYLKNWVRGTNPKMLFQRIKGSSAANDITLTKKEDGVNANSSGANSDIYFHMEFDPKNPTLRSYVQLSDETFSVCYIEKVPIQRWVNVIVSVQGQVMDLYMDGKLHKHCEMKNAVRTMDKETSIYIFGGDPIQGKISKLEYINKDIRPQRAWEIYVDGPRDSSLIGNWLNRYMLRIQWLKDGSVEKEYKI